MVIKCNRIWTYYYEKVYSTTSSLVLYSLSSTWVWSTYVDEAPIVFTANNRNKIRGKMRGYERQLFSSCSASAATTTTSIYSLKTKTITQWEQAERKPAFSQIDRQARLMSVESELANTTWNESNDCFLEAVKTNFENAYKLVDSECSYSLKKNEARPNYSPSLLLALGLQRKATLFCYNNNNNDNNQMEVEKP